MLNAEPKREKKWLKTVKLVKIRNLTRAGMRQTTNNETFQLLENESPQFNKNSSYRISTSFS